jgi:uncharacterized protein
MPHVVHFEITADEPQRAIRFYQDVFDWNIQGTEVVEDYWLVDTKPDGQAGINGAIMPRYWPQACINTVEVDDLEETLSKVIAAGGKQVAEKNQIPGVGQFVYCQDTEGNMFGLLEPFPNGRI